MLTSISGPLIPALVLYLSEVYKRHELNQRLAILFSAISLAGAFSGLLAFAILHLDGKGGKPGWRCVTYNYTSAYNDRLGIIAGSLF